MTIPVMRSRSGRDKSTNTDLALVVIARKTRLHVTDKPVNYNNLLIMRGGR
jgi:hypothetical protein